MKIKYLIPFLGLLTFFSCGREKENLEISMIRGFPDSTFLVGEKTAVIVEDAMPNLYVFDSILVFSLNNPSFLFRAYSLNTYKKLGDLLMKGRGPGEFINILFAPQSPEIRGKDIKVWIRDHKSKMNLLNLSQTLNTGKTVIDREYDFARPGKKNELYASGAVCMIKDGLFLMNRAVHTIEEKEAGLKGSYYLLYDFDKSKGMDTLHYRYNLDGWTWLNEDKSKLVETSLWEDMIKIYDLNKKQETVLMHEKKTPEQIYSWQNPGGRKPDYVYVASCPGKNRIFALYCQLNDKLMNISENSYVHVFTINGDPLHNLKLNEKLETIAYDDRTSVLYGLDSEGQLYAYDLKEII